MMFCWNDGWGSEKVREQTDDVKSNAAEKQQWPRVGAQSDKTGRSVDKCI